MRSLKLILIIIAVMSGLTIFSLMVSWIAGAGEPGDEPLPPEEPVETQVMGPFHCHVEIRDDLHRPDAFFGIVEAYPAGEAQWAVITTHSHTAETLGYTLIRIRGISVPSQFADRTRPLVFAERERKRFDKAMSYVWALISQSETLVLRNPKAVDGEGYVLCDVSVKIGGHELDLSKMMIADGHARPTGKWDWGARDVYEKEQTENETH